MIKLILLNLASFVSTVSLGIAAGIAFAHALEWPNKALLNAGQYLFIQQHLYQGFGNRAGPVEGIARFCRKP